MKLGLFILSILGFCATAFCFSQELQSTFEPEHIIYIFLLAILMCNCGLGIILTYPGSRRKKIKITDSRVSKAG